MRITFPACSSQPVDPTATPSRTARAALLLGCTSCISLALISCGVLKVKTVRAEHGRRDRLESAVFSDQPSERTQQTLRLMGLAEKRIERPLEVIVDLERLYRRSREPELLATKAELALLAAKRLEPLDPGVGAGWFLVAAARSFEYLYVGTPIARRAFDTRLHEMRDVYNFSVGAYIRLMPALHGGYRPHLQSSPFETFVVQFGISRPEHVKLSEFDALVPANDLRIKGLRNRYLQDGVGASLVAIRENRQTEPIDRFYPPEGLTYPVTALIAFEPQETTQTRVTRTRARICLHDSRRALRERIRGEVNPLAADFTAPHAYLLDRAALPTGLFSPERAMARAGLFLTEPYDPDKIPVIMIHGLRSSPLAWMELINDLIGERSIRNAFQVWHYMYPTALPYLFVADHLRRDLEQLRVAFDPEADDLATREMILIGHSMGGLVARALISESGRTIWSKILRVPPEEVRLSEEDRERLRQLLIFSPQPCIRRVIFIATPHRGSEMADSHAGHLGAGLAQRPEAYQELVERFVKDNRDLITPEMVKLFDRGGPISIRTLSPTHPTMLAFSQLPISPSVPYHSIMGNRGKPDDETRSDGVVEYASSHLVGAQSELMVPSGHGAYSHPLAIMEIKRILKLHLAETTASLAATGG